MAISYVNGFLCTCSCDVSKAKRGENPHPNTNPTESDRNNKDTTSSASRDDQPAVVYGGSLSATSSTDAVKALDGTSATDPITRWNPGFIVDQLA